MFTIGAAAAHGERDRSRVLSKTYSSERR